MSTIRMPGRSSIVALLAMCLAAAPAAAQEFPDFGGVETRLGVANAQEGGTGFAATLELDLGFVNNPALRGIAGFDYYGADLDGDQGRQGSFDAAGAMAGIRWDLLIGRTQPYLVGLVTAHNVNASATDPVAEDLLEGFYAGVGLGAGVMYGLGDDGRFNLIGDIRRVFANNIGRWNFAVGMRYLLAGPMAYAREGEQGRMAGEQPQEQQPVAGEQERDVERERQQVVAMEDESGLYQQLTNLEGELSVLSDVQQLDGGVLVELRDRMFESGSASLTMSAQNELSRMARLLMDYEIRSVSIDAFTSGDEAEAGVEAQGRQLAQRRAEAVRTALVREGFDPLRITATGQIETGGMAEPGAEMESDRVEIVLRGIGASSR